MNTAFQSQNNWSHATGFKRAMLLVALLVSLVIPVAPVAESAPAAAVASSITVDTLVDASPYDPNDGKCSLREAIEASNQKQAIGDCPAGSGIDLITFSVQGTITFKKEMRISNDVGIQGPIILSGGGAQQIFVVSTSSSSLSLSSLTLQDGKTSGGGGAILNNGILNVIGSSFQNNIAKGDGGAINSVGQVAILMTTFAGNEAGANNSTTKSGGAIYIGGSKLNLISLSNFSGNSANGSGGAINVGSSADVEISDSIFSGNIAHADGTNQGGGAIHNKGNPLEIIRCAFNGNLSPNGSGGALYNGTSTSVSIEDSSFNGNIAGDYNTDGKGGAIFNLDVMDITRSTFNGNIASLAGEGGGIHNDHGEVNVTNSTFFANTALTGKGGAAYNTDTNDLVSKSIFNFRHVTFSDNTADTEGEAIFNIIQGARAEEVNLYNSIVKGSAAADTCGGQEPVDGGGNLQHPGSTCGSSITVADPKLEVPFFNGGALVSLLSMALKDGSPAIDAADNTVCAAAPVNNEDQRGESRPNDGDGDGTATCDSGAYEAETAVPGYGSTPVQPGPIQFGSTTVATTIPVSFPVYETGNATLKVTSLTIGGTHAGDFAVTTGPFDILNGGASVAVDMTCTPSEVGERSATLTLTTNDPDHPSVAYQLLCTGTAQPVPSYGSTPPSPGPVDFGDSPVGTAKIASFTVFENGTDTLSVSSPALGGLNPGDFSITTVFPFTIADGGAPKPVSLTCTPSQPGIRTATLTVTTNDPDKPTVSYNLVCNGFIPPVPPLDFGSPIPGGNYPYDVDISSDGAQAYVTNHNPSSLQAYDRIVDTGNLMLTQTYNHAGLNVPYGVVVSPDGAQVFAVSHSLNKLFVLDRDPSNGLVSTEDVITDGELVGCNPICLYVNGLDGADGIAISQNGKSLYVAGKDDNSVSLFSRTVPTGTVIYRRSWIDGQFGMTGLVEARDVVLSPDGNNVYVAADNPGSVVTFSRDPISGYLSYIESYPGGGDPAMGGATAVTAHPDGTQVYVVTDSASDKTLRVFNRNLADGKLTLAQTLTENGAVQGLHGANGVSVNPDGSQIYVSSTVANALAVFTRNPLSGELSFAAVYKDNVDGVNGLWWASKVTTSPEGSHIYVTGYLDHMIAVFRRSRPTPLLLRLLPSSAEAGGPAFTMTVHGEDFSPDTVVRWNGSDRPTTFVSSGLLQIAVAATDIATAGNVPVDAYTPAPGGGTSNTLNFTVTAPGDNPVPTIRDIDPAGALAGSEAFTMTVSGGGFVDGAVVLWNGAERQTTYLSGGILQAQIPATDIAAPGPAGVTVKNPSPGGGISNTVLFDVSAPGENPRPSIRSLSPASVYETGASGSDLIVTVHGANFVPGSIAYLDGDPRLTHYVDGTHLEVTLTAGDTAFAGGYSVSVVNPEPGGGKSNGVTFQVFAKDKNLVPAITSLSVERATSGDGGVLTVDGIGFATGAATYWNDGMRTTTVVSDTQLTVDLSAVDIQTGEAIVYVVNPPPGGGESNTILFKFTLPSLPPPPERKIYLPLMTR